MFHPTIQLYSSSDWLLTTSELNLTLFSRPGTSAGQAPFVIAFQRAGIKGLTRSGHHWLSIHSYVPFLPSSPFHCECRIAYICLLCGKHVHIFCIPNPIRIGSAKQSTEGLRNLHPAWSTLGCSYCFCMCYLYQLFISCLIYQS